MSFLLWSLLSPVTDDSPVPWNPTDKSLLRLATDIYALLEAHFEQAPLTDDESMDWLPEIRALLPPPGPVLDIFPELAEQPQKSDAIRQRSVVGNRMYLMYFCCFIKILSVKFYTD